MSGRTAGCPSCGAPIEFRNAATVLVVCASCGGASTRKGLDFTRLGRVAEVTPIESLLDLGTTGRFEGRTWTAVGQVQLDHGEGPWNEWCLLFDDGTWGWLGEAQGEILITRPAPALPVPPHGKLHPGDAVDLGAGGSFVVAEVGRARITAVRGELPVPVKPGAPRLYADLRRGADGFGTLDYGDDAACDGIFTGRKVTPAEAGLDPSRAGPERRAEGARIQCPQCGGEIPLRDAEGSIRVSCASCGSLLDPRDPKAGVLGAAARVRSASILPLGARGKLRGLDVEVLAHLVRSVTVDGTRYPWGEYLLKVAKGGGYRWLSESSGHWVLLAPVSLGEVSSTPGSAKCRGEVFKHFQGGTAVVDAVFGEVYWEVEVGEKVRSEDYVRPPKLLSIETSGKERNATLGEYCPPEEIAAAFGLKHPVKTPIGAGACQPNPHKTGLAKWWIVCGLFAAADVITMIVASSADREVPGFPCCMTLPILLLPAIVQSTRAGNFEKERWEESDHPIGGDSE